MKPGTFSQLYIHIVFAVQERKNFLLTPVRPKIFEYMCGIIRNLKHKPIIVNGTEDHVHIFLGLNPSVSISDTVHDIKRGSSIFINKEKIIPSFFKWQEGYGAFSCGKSQIDNVYNYIKNQEIHHKEKSFREEYKNSWMNLELFMIQNTCLNFTIKFHNLYEV